MSNQIHHLYVELDDGLQQKLAEEGIDIPQIIREAGLDITIEYATPLAEEAGNSSNTRDPALVIIASASLICAAGTAISNVLNTIQNRPLRDKIVELEELRDKDGNIIFDETGKPIFKKTSRPVLLQPTQTSKDSIVAQLGKYLSLKISSEKKNND
jgi:hypothetical protein